MRHGELLRWARHLVHDLGLSVIPIWRPEHGHKGKESRLPSWLEFQHRRPVDSDLIGWFQSGRSNLAIVTGAISGGVDVDSGVGEMASFQAACRLVHGYLLTDDQALALLVEWAHAAGHAWDVEWLAAKVRAGRTHGSEAPGGLLG